MTPQEGQTTPISADDARATVFDVDLVIQGLAEKNTLGPHETGPTGGGAGNFGEIPRGAPLQQRNVYHTI